MDCTNIKFGICLKCFPFMIGSCNVCGCSRDRHDFNTNRKYIDEYKQVKINNYNEINNEIWKYNREKNNINDKIESKKYESNCIKNEIIDLNDEIDDLNNNIIDYCNQKNQINKLSENVLDMIFKLKNIETKINDMAMNKHHLEIENEYIDSLVQYIEQIGIDEYNQIKTWKKNIQYYKIYQEIINIPSEDLDSLGIEYFIDKFQ